MIGFLLGNELYYFNETPDVEARLDTDDYYAKEFLSKHLGIEVAEFERVEIENAINTEETEGDISSTREDETKVEYLENKNQEPQSVDNVKAVPKWDDMAVKLFLIELGKYKYILKKGAAKTERVYSKIAEALQSAGYTYINTTNCQNKMKSLLATYRRNVARKQSGAATITWEHFAAMEDIFKIRARIYVPKEYLIDTLDEEFVNCNNENSNNAIADPLDYVSECYDDVELEETPNDYYGDTISEEAEEKNFVAIDENQEKDMFDRKSEEYTQQQKENDFMERFLKISEERNVILKEILNVMKSKV